MTRGSLTPRSHDGFSNIRGHRPSPPHLPRPPVLRLFQRPLGLSPHLHPPHPRPEAPRFVQTHANGAPRCSLPGAGWRGSAEQPRPAIALLVTEPRSQGPTRARCHSPGPAAAGLCLFHPILAKLIRTLGKLLSFPSYPHLPSSRSFLRHNLAHMNRGPDTVLSREVTKTRAARGSQAAEGDCVATRGTVQALRTQYHLEYERPLPVDGFLCKHDRRISTSLGKR